jgi:tetratricopeptide (TPR) repeat protein
VVWFENMNAVGKNNGIVIPLGSSLGRIIFIILISLSAAPKVFAGYELHPTDIEFKSLSPVCQRAFAGSNSGLKYGFAYKLHKSQPDNVEGGWGKASGPWHYCGGLIRIQRGELTLDPVEREKRFRHGISDIMYTYTKTDKTNPRSAEMAAGLARGYRDLGETKKAKKYLDEALKYHPDYAGAYTMYAMLYYDEGNYKTAKDYLLKADKAGKGKSSEVIYFLGLASLKLDQLDEARKYAEQAADMGYPLTGLQDKLKALENAGNKQ